MSLSSKLPFLEVLEVARFTVIFFLRRTTADGLLSHLFLVFGTLTVSVKDGAVSHDCGPSRKEVILTCT